MTFSDHVIRFVKKKKVRKTLKEAGKDSTEQAMAPTHERFLHQSVTNVDLSYLNFLKLSFIKKVNSIKILKLRGTRGTYIFVFFCWKQVSNFSNLHAAISRFIPLVSPIHQNKP